MNKLLIGTGVGVSIIGAFGGGFLVGWKVCAKEMVHNLKDMAPLMNSSVANAISKALDIALEREEPPSQQELKEILEEEIDFFELAFDAISQGKKAS